MSVSETIERALVNHRSGNLQQAETIYRQVLETDPNQPDALHLLGMIAHQMGRNDVAIDLINRAITIKPGVSFYHDNLGTIHQALGDIRQAVQCYLHALEIQPAFASAHGHLGNIFFMLGRLDEAINHLRKSLVQGENIDQRNILGGALWTEGRIPEAVRELKKALDLQPASAPIHSNYLIVLGHVYPYDPERMLAEHRRWAQRHADLLLEDHKGFTNTPEPDRRLRIGYVSPHFRDCGSAYFMEAMLAGHDRKAFEVICYSDVRKPDALTTRFRSHADIWRESAAWNDQQLLEQINSDQIDILVDICGHLMGNRLQVFARKPAPLQVSTIGYENTTGLQAIDFRLSDELTDPAGMTDSHFVEKIIRLPRAYCYRPPEPCPSVGPLPVEENGFITFGCTCHVAKITDDMVRLTWANLMKATPKSRMILQSNALNEPTVRRDLLDWFEGAGITADRLELIGWTSMDEYLKVFQRMDIALDTFPLNGRTTICHALWMGVPVVTQVGDFHAARIGLSLLTHAGLPELAAKTSEEYIKIATDLAKDQPRLAELRKTLRQRLQDSPLMDQAVYSKSLSDTYRQLWTQWCEGQKTEG